MVKNATCPRITTLRDEKQTCKKKWLIKCQYISLQKMKQTCAFSTFIKKEFNIGWAYPFKF